jgi:multidrug efflux pump subunit AcrB
VLFCSPCFAIQFGFQADHYPDGDPVQHYRVLFGFALTGMTVSAIFTGMGIVGLAGIVVKNGILVIEFAEELRQRGLRTREAVIEAGKTRIIPVLLTALAAIFGLIPLASVSISTLWPCLPS